MEIAHQIATEPPPDLREAWPRRARRGRARAPARDGARAGEAARVGAASSRASCRTRPRSEDTRPHSGSCPPSRLRRRTRATRRAPRRGTPRAWRSPRMVAFGLAASRRWSSRAVGRRRTTPAGRLAAGRARSRPSRPRRTEEPEEGKKEPKRRSPRRRRRPPGEPAAPRSRLGADPAPRRAERPGLRR